ncbi:MAG: hypothetical protein Q4A30_01755 [Candidatus Saccharibacteria bacterium]|nr:hypothetical protein [Candidatus Saccharibacteria bacterium]
MFSTLALIPGSKNSGKLMGTHQKLDRIARHALGRALSRQVYFPTSKEILAFEGMKGPDGIKRKSPGVDDPMHFILPDHDDGQLVTMITNHQYNLAHALTTDNHVRAAFEAAWMAHAVADGLTPAHHFPLSETAEQLMTEKEFIKIFGVPVKGLMHGRNFLETARHNWLYWGADGFMSKHIAFEYGVMITTATLPDRLFYPQLTSSDLQHVDLRAKFYQSLHTIANLDMYTRFCKGGWTADLALETKDILLPEIVKAIIFAWASSIPALNPDVLNLKTDSVSKSTTKKSSSS